MNRMDRLFAITTLLQARKRLRAQDLAREFEVTERTIYRDMAALSESGVPVVGLPSEGYELYVGAYCRLRNEVRNFRLNRIEALKILDATFKPRQYAMTEREEVPVRIRFAPDAVRWVRERQHYGYRSDENNESCDANGTVMVYAIESFAEIKDWLLMWGASAELLSPLLVREMIREEAAKMLSKHS